MDDTKIIDLYFLRDEQAIAETDAKYGHYCFSLADSILKSREDSEEVVSDTWWKAWDAIPPARPSFFRMFLAKITRNLAFSRWRKYSAQKRGSGEMAVVLEELQECIPASESVEDQVNLKDLIHAIQTFLEQQPEREQDIFLRRYFFVEDTSAIAARYGMKPDSVLRSLSRTRIKLKLHLEQEGFQV